MRVIYLKIYWGKHMKQRKETICLPKQQGIGTASHQNPRHNGPSKPYKWINSPCWRFLFSQTHECLLSTCLRKCSKSVKYLLDYRNWWNINLSKVHTVGRLLIQLGLINLPSLYRVRKLPFTDHMVTYEIIIWVWVSTKDMLKSTMTKSLWFDVASCSKKQPSRWTSWN